VQNLMPWLFSYGTLRDERVQLETFGRRLHGRPDALVGFAPSTMMVDDAEFVAKSGAATHAVVMATGNDQDRVPGTVFEVSDAELTSADRYEPAGYARVLVTLASGTQAWVYAGTRSPIRAGAPG
jgi:gamma-glutamylcyclotransferase (GGCT)/AIG2-like uncharacterized protein YtfP